MAPPAISLVVARLLSPEQELVAEEAARNCRWFCDSIPVPCRCVTRRSIPPERAAFHPWFARFHHARSVLAAAAADASRPATHCIHLDGDALLLSSSPKAIVDWLPKLSADLVAGVGAGDGYGRSDASTLRWVGTQATTRVPAGESKGGRR